MSKTDHIRDYATEAFRFYKSVGGAEAYKNKIWNDCLMRSQKPDVNGFSSNNGSIGKPTEAAIMQAQRAIDEAMATIADLEAVERTLEIIGKMKSWADVLQAINIVYFTESEKDLEKGDIQARVHKASLYIPAGEATVYRYLKKARTMFAIERGLRL